MRGRDYTRLAVVVVIGGAAAAVVAKQTPSFRWSFARLFARSTALTSRSVLLDSLQEAVLFDFVCVVCD